MNMVKYYGLVKGKRDFNNFNKIISQYYFYLFETRAFNSQIYSGHLLQKNGQNFLCNFF